jgi:nucleolar MIF4G domain-containing protein 1
VRPKTTVERRDKNDVPKGDVKPLSLPENLSQSVAEKLAQDDAEITSLERKLGLRGKKRLPQAFRDDGLDKLLDGLYEYSDSNSQDETQNGIDESQWFARKHIQGRNSSLGEYTVKGETSSRRKDSRTAEPLESFSGNTYPDDDSSTVREGKEKALSDSEGDPTFSDSEFVVMPSTTRARENPYVAPLADNIISATYIPPSLRSASPSELENLATLRRQVQGLTNRLTESNLISILDEVENLYQNNARNHVTSTIVDIVLTSVCSRTSLPDTLIILWAGFTAAIYKIIGADFGAQFIQRAVELLGEHYVRAEESGDNSSAATLAESGKEASNLIILLAELYIFQVVGSNLVFDYIRWFLDTLSELNVELLLKIVRTSGPLLRQEDPSSLKSIVGMLSPIVAKHGENMSVRTKFMIEMINDLKNNRVKTGISASIVTSEHIIRMKKTLGTLNTRNVKASEPLRIGLRDIQDSDKKGKWWLVGASWVGNEAHRNDYKESFVSTSGGVCGRSVNLAEAGASKLAELAREQRMNTDIRQAIFITVMSATDYEDAYLRLMKLRLKKAQELEIPKILIHCLSAEKAYNPYYTLIAKKLCSDRKLKVAFRFNLWDIFKKLGEKGGDEGAVEDDDSGSALDMRKLVNLAKMFGSLIADGSLALSMLKCLRFRYLQAKTKVFVEVLLVTVLLQSQVHVEDKRDKHSVANIILNVGDAPEIAEGLQRFMRRVVSKTDITSCEAEKATIRWACKVAVGALEGIATRNTSGA